MRILNGTIKRLDVALEYGRSAVDFTREAIDSLQTVQALKRVVGEAADRAFMVSVFRAPLSIFVKDYSADPLDDTAIVDAALSPVVNFQASFRRELDALELIGDGTLQELLHEQMAAVENQLDDWGSDIFAAVAAVASPDAMSVSKPNFMKNDVWVSIEHFFRSHGLKIPATGTVPFAPYRAALSHEAEKRGIKSDLKQALGVHQYALTIYSTFLANREQLENAIRISILSSPAMK